MIVSRLFPALLRNPNLYVGGRKLITTSSPLRGGHVDFVYRGKPTPAKKWVIIADVAGGIMWWWIFWNLFTNYGHIIGEYDYPDALKWTDEELGIPPDDEDDPE